jgi:hypothetical protein
MVNSKRIVYGLQESSLAGEAPQMGSVEKHASGAIAFSELVYSEASLLSRRDHQGALTFE